MKPEISPFPALELKNKDGHVYIQISVNEADQYIYNNWIGKLTQENVLEGATIVLEAIRRSCYYKLLNDNTEVIGSWEGSNDWIENVWTPNAIRLGLKYFAHVVPLDVYAAFSAEQMQQRVVGKFEMRLFGNAEEAKRWLNSLKK